MRTISIIFLFLSVHRLNAWSPTDTNATTQGVREYFLRQGKQASMNNLEWVPNSGKIGSGFDTISGSPTCFTGQCQMEGFRRSIFKLNITQVPEGSCTKQLIPQDVDLQCLTSMQMTAKTETIATLQQLQESTKKGLEISVGAEVFGNSLRYTHSTEIRTMVDTVVEKNSTVYFTQVTVTWARLTAFVQSIALSEQFVYAISRIPCCNDSPELTQYVQEFVIDQFGLTYIKDLLLGGIAQQQVIISEENRKTLRSEGFSQTNEAEAKAAAYIFSNSFKVGITEEINKAQIEKFKQYSQQNSITTLGGTSSIQSMEEWSRTIPSNPAVIKFRIASILDLLTTSRFPTDPNIEKKRDLVRKVQERYIDSPVFCYKNCSGHGLCVSSGYFGFGQCRCNPGWIGKDCSTGVRLPQGLMTIPYANDTCPTGFKLDAYIIGNYRSSRSTLVISSRYEELKVLQMCHLLEGNTGVGPQGTLCGFVYFGLQILCGGRSPLSEPCPDGFEKYIWTRTGRYPLTFWACRKSTTNVSELSGTLCGFHSTITSLGGVDIACDGYDLGRGKCPPDYTLYHAYTDVALAGATVSFCAKN